MKRTLFFLIMLALASTLLTQEIIGISATHNPEKEYYLLGETIAPQNLTVNILYDDTTSVTTTNYNLSGDTFTVGEAIFKVTSPLAPDDSTFFSVTVTDTLVTTGLPVIYINTLNGAEILDRETWVTMDIKIVSDNIEHCLELTGQQIRGRGNSTWIRPKKPYRIRLTNAAVNAGVSPFGRTPARNWVLLANYRDVPLLANALAFELGHRLDLEYTCTYQYVDVVLNGNYVGNYMFTEHRSIASNSVDIDEMEGYLVEFDDYYDEDPKFRTPILNLPVMIKNDVYGADVNDPGYDFVREAMNIWDIVLSTDSLNMALYEEQIDVESLINYLMVNEIASNPEIGTPRSTFMYIKDKNNDPKIKLGPLWDFDTAFGMSFSLVSELYGVDERFLAWDGNYWDTYPSYMHWARLWQDPEFVERYRERWQEILPRIVNINDWIDEMRISISTSWVLNNKRWLNNGNMQVHYTNMLKIWMDRRISFLNQEIMGVDILPLPPQNLQAIAGDGLVNLSWEAPMTSLRNATGYKVYRDSVAITVTLSSMRYIDLEVVNGQEYHYYVTALYDDYCWESAPSNTVTVTPEVIIPVFPEPYNLTAVAGDEVVTLGWEIPDLLTRALTGFVVYRDSVAIASSLTMTYYIDNDVINGQEYFYYVTALYTNPVGESVPSNIVTVSPEAAIQVNKINNVFPNPFKYTTTIQYCISLTSNVTIQIFNIKGQLVTTLTDKRHTEGVSYVDWNGTDARGRAVSSGVYFVRLKTNNSSHTKKLIYIK